jgi:transketolase
VVIITMEVARPDFPVADRSTFADTDLGAAAKGFYVIRDFAPGAPRHGYVITHGSSSTVNLVSVLPKLEAAGVNVKVIAAISEELFDRQPESYRHAVLPPDARYDLMVVTTGTRRVWPLKDVGPVRRRARATDRPAAGSHRPALKGVRAARRAERASNL